MLLNLGEELRRARESLAAAAAARLAAPVAAAGPAWDAGDLADAAGAAAGGAACILAAGARDLVPVVVTLGPGLEDEVRALTAGGQFHAAFRLDEAGNSLLGEAAVETARRLGGVWLAPGCHGLPLSLVPGIAAAAGAAEAGVTVLASGMLRPEKSVAGLVAVGGRRPAGCETCASAVCPWRGAGVPGCG
jgi:hypothetical protein